MEQIIQTIAVYAIPVILAITLHEAAHAYAARYFGDNTAYAQGRMTLNPIVHIDPIGTVLIPLVLYIATSGAFLFGYAKPVPVNIFNLRRPKQHMLWVAAAGPASNLLMAVGWVLFGLLVTSVGINERFVVLMVQAGVLVNLIMFAFNLFPLPPLDGGRMVVSLLPMRLAEAFARIEPYGFFIVMALVISGAMNFWMRPVLALGYDFVTIFLK